MGEGLPPFDPPGSPDRAWRWDGRTWVPGRTGQPRMEPADVPVRTPVAAEHAVIRPPDDPPEADEAVAQETGEKEAVDGRGWPMVGALIGASLVVIALVIGVALLAYRTAGSPPPGPAPAKSAQPVDPNALRYHYLPGVTVGDLTGSLADDGFSCRAPAPPESNLRDWRCDRGRGSQHDVVQIWAVDESHIHLVEVTTVARAGLLDEQGALQLDARVAQVVYGAATPAAAAAINWVNANPTGGASTRVGAITLRTQRSGVATLLEFDAGSRS